MDSFSAKSAAYTTQQTSSNLSHHLYDGAAREETFAEMLMTRLQLIGAIQSEALGALLESQQDAEGPSQQPPQSSSLRGSPGNRPAAQQSGGVYRPTTVYDMAAIPKGAKFVNPANGHVLTKAC